MSFGDFLSTIESDRLRAGCSGMLNQNTLPRPGWLSAPASPPIRLAR